MPTYTTADLRNLALFGSGGAGKTTLAEAIMHSAGVIGHLGQVEKGNTLSDFTDEEKRHNHSLFSSILHCEHQGKHINLIDTPGFADFLGQSLSVLPAIETAVIVINAAAGVEPVTRRIMERAGDRNLCRMIVINKIDLENLDLPTLLDQVKESFGSACLPINLPAEGCSKVIDCFFNNEGRSDLGPVADYHTAIIDQVVEVDEDLMAMYLEKGEVTPEQLHDPFEKALREGHLVPICFTAARPHADPEQPIGVRELMEILVNLAPSPLEGNPRPFIRGQGADSEEFHGTPDPDQHVLAHVFKVVNDRFGKLAAFRVHQGSVRKDTQLYVGDARKPIKVGHLYRVHGKDHVEVDGAIPGDIAALMKSDEAHYNVVLHDDPGDNHIHLKPLALPDPMFGLAIEARKRGDEQKIADSLNKIREEDPTFRVRRDPVTHETVISGVGELHLRVILEKLKDRYGVDVDTRPPKIAYRETISTKAEGHHRHKKQTGGAGQFGEVFLRVEPLERDAGFEFVDDTFGGSIPHQYIPAVEKGVRQVLETGAIAGYPLQDIRVSVYDGKHHPVDSKEVAFVTAGKRAFLDAIQKAKPTILEPCVLIEVTVPNQYMGDITSDLSGKRGRIQGTDILGGDQTTIRAIVPLAEVMNYQNQLKSVTGGQGSFTMQFSHYDPVPGNLQQQIVSAYKPREEED